MIMTDRDGVDTTRRGAREQGGSGLVVGAAKVDFQSIMTTVQGYWLPAR